MDLHLAVITEFERILLRPCLGDKLFLKAAFYRIVLMLLRFTLMKALQYTPAVT